MGTGWRFSRPSRTRPSKNTSDRARRIRTQRRRLVALGMDEAAVAKLDPQVVRTLLRKPAKVTAKVTAKAAAQV